MGGRAKDKKSESEGNEIESDMAWSGWRNHMEIGMEVDWKSGREDNEVEREDKDVEREVK